MLPWVEKKAHDNVYYFDAFTARLRQKAKTRAHKYYDIPLEYALQSEGGWYTGQNTYNPHQIEVLTKARYTRKQIVEPYVITYDDEMDASTPEKVLDIVQIRANNAVKRLQTSLISAIFGDATVSAVEGNMVTGLKNFVAESNPTTWYVGGIDRDDTTAWEGKWLGNVHDKNDGEYGGNETGVKLTPHILRKLIAEQEDLPSGSMTTLTRPTLAVTTFTIYALIRQWTAEKQRFTVQGKTANYGFEHTTFEGVTVLPSHGCDAGYLYLISEDHYGMIVHPGWDVKMKPIHPVEEGTYSIGQVVWSGAMWSNACEKLSVIKDIDVEL